MRILISAFACAPGVGSEGGKGWRYAVSLGDKHRVFVVTDIARRPQIEADPCARKPGLTFVYYRPALLRKMPLNSLTALFIYEAWQAGAWRIARRLDRQHDLDFIWHLTYGTFRHPSHYWRIGKPFVFGPLGGGETSPRRLRRGLRLRDQAKEWFRDICNRLVVLRPALRATYRNSCLTIACTEATRAALPAAARSHCVVQEAIGGYAGERPRATDGEKGGPLRVLFVGRLLWWKGLDFALNAVAAASALGSGLTFTIIGEGPAEVHVRRVCNRLRLDHRVIFIKHMAQPELFKKYFDYDVLLFPSLHDSGGNVVLEALSHGLPVVCLDLGGPSVFVNAECGVVVPAQQASSSEVNQALGSALARLDSDRGFLAVLSEGAHRRATDLTLEQQIARCVSLIETHVPGLADAL